MCIFYFLLALLISFLIIVILLTHGPMLSEIKNIYLLYIHTYHSRVIPEGVAEVSQTFLRDTHVLRKLVSVTDGKPIAV
jgi:hypothetical protein